MYLIVENFDVRFNTDTELKEQYAILKSPTYTTQSANDTVIFLSRNFKKEPIILEYESSTPYWFFHDLAHALYTPDLFIPRVQTIEIEKEKAMYSTGVELARKYNLPEEYIESVQRLKDENII